ncbi:MAG: sulfatase-like hydrolase/transferase [Planctomycetaceae bacterium]
MPSLLQRQRTWLCLVLWAFTGVWALHHSVAQAVERPNVLLILVDDLKPALGCYGDSTAQTPHLDALAARGMQFDLAYCNQAVCAPSRFTLMLGSHSTSTGLYGLGSQLRRRWPTAVTLPQHFGQHGYRTESLGKVFHIGHGNEGDPESFAVPHFQDKVIEYVDPASTEGGQLTREEAYFTNQRLGEIRSLPRGAAFEAPNVEDEAYADGRVAAETVRRLQAARDRRQSEGTPFFIAAGFARPHLPFCAPKKYWDLYSPAQIPKAAVAKAPVDAPNVADKTNSELANYTPVPDDGVVASNDELGRKLVHGYYASVSYVDAQIGKVLAELDRLQLTDSTIVVLWGDHGFHLGDHGYWTKHTNYEEANRIPLIIAAPGATPPGSATQQLAESADIYPTLCELAGLPIPAGPQPIDGVSLVPVLHDPQVRVRDHAYHAYPKATVGRAIRTDRYRLVEWKQPGAEPETAELELYDYQTDPDETHNFAASEPEIVKTLRGILARYPEAVDPNAKSSPGDAAVESPQIANREIEIKAQVRGRPLKGVVLAQGGQENGYALHFIDGVPALDVRVRGQVTRLQGKSALSGPVELHAAISSSALRLTANGQTVTAKSPGLFPSQPQDELSIGQDTRSAAGRYVAPHPFTGQVLSQQVTTSGVMLAQATPAAARVEWNDQPGRWSEQRVWDWYDQQPWPVGANYITSSAINQLEMWQPETFDPESIDRELGWAAKIEMNCMRVFLHEIPWQQDESGFFDRVDKYLEIADRHHIRTMFVLFDGVWDPQPKGGKQPAPRPGLHNSGWVQSPGRDVLSDSARQDNLKPYVQAVLKRYQDDPRVLAWDLFNEPDNGNDNSYGEHGMKAELPKDQKAARAEELLRKAFDWAREIGPSQPLTCGVWHQDYLGNPSSIARYSLEASDVISFHTYDAPEKALRLTTGLLELGRPVICTEYMARGNKLTFETILPIFHKHKVGAINWGLVDGKSQTKYPWDSWQKPYTTEPQPWHHDVFHTDGKPYSQQEVNQIGGLVRTPPTAKKTPPKPKPVPPRAALESGLQTRDRALYVKSGWIRDPYIVPGPDGWYYLTGTTPNPDDPREQSDPYNTGLGDLSLVGWQAQVWRSRDLLDWQSMGTPFTLQDGIWAQKRPQAFASADKADWKLWAPELHWLGDRWALVQTSPAPVKGANLALSAGSEIAGPWSHPMGTAIERRHDPSLFRDDDGTWYLLWGATTLAPLKPDFSGFASSPIDIGPTGETKAMGHEGCLMRKIDGKYVLFGTGWSTGEMRHGSYNLYYAVADKITGPYSERRFVGRFLGHGTPFQDQQGSWWCTAFYNGNVPPLATDGIEQRDIRDTASTINEQGLTLVPLEVTTSSAGEPIIRAIPSAYRQPGPDEKQTFSTKPGHD